jgi:hypothetical protein
MAPGSTITRRLCSAVNDAIEYLFMTGPLRYIFQPLAYYIVIAVLTCSAYLRMWRVRIKQRFVRSREEHWQPQPLLITTNARRMEIRKRLNAAFIKFVEFLFKSPWSYVCRPFACIVYWPVIMMSFHEKGSWRASIKGHFVSRDRRKRAVYWKPRPLVTNAPKRETWRTVTRLFQRHSKQNPAQDPSPFFGRLPPELRKSVYEFVLHDTAHRLHIQQSYRRFGSIPCRQHDQMLDALPCMNHLACFWNQLDFTKDEQPQRHSRFVLGKDKHLRYKPEVVSRYDYWPARIELLGMALSCRKGYEI